MKMRDQSLKYGATIKTETVERVDLSAKPYTVFTAGAEYKTMTVIIATGATAQRLDFPGGLKFHLLRLSQFPGFLPHW